MQVVQRRTTKEGSVITTFNEWQTMENLAMEKLLE